MRTVYLCGLFSQNPSFKSNKKNNNKKKIKQIPSEGHFTKYLTNIPQNCQGHYKQVWETITAMRSLRKCDD